VAAQAAPLPHNHKAALAPTRQEMVEDRINVRIMQFPF
jgi:hypothetical protein